MAGKTSKLSKWHATPLKGSFMVASIIGFLFTIYYINDLNWRTTFVIVFIAMFIASIISMTKAPVSERGIK